MARCGRLGKGNRAYDRGGGGVTEKLEPGDLVLIKGSDGRSRHYLVVEKKRNEGTEFTYELLADPEIIDPSAQ
jgi:hypothetical protein